MRNNKEEDGWGVEVGIDMAFRREQGEKRTFDESINQASKQINHSSSGISNPIRRQISRNIPIILEAQSSSVSLKNMRSLLKKNRLRNDTLAMTANEYQ